MDVEVLYEGARRRFRRRNKQVLPQVQLQWGANERWFAREFALAMNHELCGAANARCLGKSGLYADCEYRFGDISVWSERSAVVPVHLWEVKTMYSTYSSPGRLKLIAEEAADQLRRSRLRRATHRAALFVLVYVAKDMPRSEHRGRIARYSAKWATAISREFSEHAPFAELSPLASLDFGRHGTWWTQSWTSLGRLPRTTRT